MKITPARIDIEKCNGCGVCVEICPNEAITLNEVAHVNEDECIECESCVDECPNDAISMEIYPVIGIIKG